LLASGFSIFLHRDYDHLVATFFVVASLFVVFGQIRLLLRFLQLVVPFVLLTGAIWFAIRLDTLDPDVKKTLALVLNSHENYFSYLRVVPISSLIVLSLGTIPQSDLLTTLNQMGFPLKTATIVAAGANGVEVVKDELTRSYMALRAQGVIAHTRWSVLMKLDALVRLTWMATLNIVLARSEFKWDANGFLLTQEERTIAAHPRWNRVPTVTALLGSVLIAVVNLIPTGIHVSRPI
jgi:hypothetical protein